MFLLTSFQLQEAFVFLKEGVIFRSFKYNTSGQICGVGLYRKQLVIP